MKCIIFLLLIFSIFFNVNGQSLLKYDYMETWDWAGYWNTPSNTGWYTNASVSSDQSAVIIGNGNSSSPIEDNWYRLPNITGLDGTRQYQFRFRLASYTFSNPAAATRGVDGPDYVTVQVSRNGGAYTNELRIIGNGNATWPFNTAGNVTHTANGVFSTVNAPTGDVYPSGASATTNGPSVISLNLPVNTTQLAVDLYCRINSAGEEWWIDNIELWDITPTALPIELISFNGDAIDNLNLIKWVTASEHNSSHYLVERSSTGEFNENDVIYTTLAAGTSTAKLNYQFIDKDFTNTINYYRLTQVDLNGAFKQYGPIAIDNRPHKFIVRTINLLGQLVTTDYHGIVINIYNDGTSVKKLQ